ncbi:MAG: hypothetical protein ACI8QZ_001629 [Chlamydiales bacterium]|jgi:hypothetical protein
MTATATTTATKTDTDPTLRAAERSTISLRGVLSLWWPLAGSWLLMGADLPMFTAAVARMPDPEINLAAFGSLVFPVSLLIEAPIIMLLAASTALTTDREAYAKLRRFTHMAGAALTLLHVLVAFTGLFDWVACDVIGVPAEVVEPARAGMRIMTPWTWAIASRRFQQGVLIRYGQSRTVAAGTLARLAANIIVLWVGFSSGRLSGIVVGCSAIIAGVLAEAAFVAWRTAPVVAGHIPHRGDSAEDSTPLTRASFLGFYTPLAMTPFLTLAAQPLGAAAMARMPLALASLAAWPAVHGLVFLMRSLGIAHNEVVVTLIGRPGALASLRRFQWILIAAVTVLLLTVALTPVSGVWFAKVSGLSPDLVALSRSTLIFAIALPGCSVLHSWYQGVLLNASHSRPITEAVAISLAVTTGVFALGTYLNSTAGIHFALLGLSAGALAQAAWLAYRARPALLALRTK